MGIISKCGGRWMSRTHPLYVCLCGGGLWLVALTVRLTVGIPYAVWHIAEVVVPLPPLWLCGLLWQGMALLAGGAWGYVLGLRHRGGYREAWIFRGSMHMVLSAAGVMMWYPLLFGVMAPLLSWLCLGAAVCFGLLAVLSWWRVSRGVLFFLGGWLAWLAFLLLTQLTVMLHI